MSSWVMILMLGVSLVIGALGLVAFLWGLKNGQFDDKERMMRGVLFDDVENLNAIARQDEANKENKNKVE